MHVVARAAAEQLVDRHAERLALDVPQRGVDRGDRRHRHRPAPPVGALVEVLPDVLDAARVAPDQQRDHVVGRGSSRPPARARSASRRRARRCRPRSSIFSVTKLRPGRADDHLGVDDLHRMVHPAGQEAAVDDQDVAVDEAGRLRRQEHRRARDLLDLAEAALGVRSLSSRPRSVPSSSVCVQRASGTRRARSR